MKKQLTIVFMDDRPVSQFLEEKEVEPTIEKYRKEGIQIEISPILPFTKTIPPTFIS